MTVVTKMPKKYASGVKLRLGYLTIEGDLYPLAKSNKPKVSLVTPDGDPVKQKFVDADGNTYYKDELQRLIEDGEEEEIVTAEQVAAAKDAVLDGAKNILTLTVFGEEAERFMFPADAKGYVFLPKDDDPENVQMYGIFRHIIESGDKSFCGEAKIGRGSGFYKIVPWDGQLVVQKFTPPSEIVHYDRIEAEPGESGEKMAAALNKMSVEFNPEDFEDLTLRALRQASDVEVAAKPAEADVSSAVDAFLEGL